MAAAAQAAATAAAAAGTQSPQQTLPPPSANPSGSTIAASQHDPQPSKFANEAEAQRKSGGVTAAGVASSMAATDRDERAGTSDQ
jgi:hypothetical protein